MATVELNKGNFEQVITGNDMVIVDFWGARAGRNSAFRRKGELGTLSRGSHASGDATVESEAGARPRSLASLPLVDPR